MGLKRRSVRTLRGVRPRRRGKADAIRKVINDFTGSGEKSSIKAPHNPRHGIGDTERLTDTINPGQRQIREMEMSRTLPHTLVANDLK
jgi:hypothetical protein